jgi:hypothetical protein
MGYVDITQEQLAEEAGRVFRDSRVEDVPNKLWIDYWTGGDQHYLRAIFDGDTDAGVCDLLWEVGQRLHRRYDVRVVCVAYSGAYSWEDVEGWVMSLHKVR